MKSKDRKHVISLLVSNKPGVLIRVSLVFARRGYNIDSLVVSEETDPRFSRMTITATGDKEILDLITLRNVHRNIRGSVYYLAELICDILRASLI